MDEVGTQTSIQSDEEKERAGVGEWIRTTPRDRKADEREASVPDLSSFASVPSYDRDFGTCIARSEG